MNDLISRAALFNSLANVKTLEEVFTVIQRIPAVPVDKGFIPRESAINTALNMYHRCNGSLDDYRALMVESLEVLTGMPKAERWISCEERLPEEKQDVLLAFKKNMIVGFWENVCGDVTWYANSGDGWMTGTESVDNDGIPIAWMPLPEPWKGDE